MRSTTTDVGNALYSLRRYEEALPAYTRATELAPEETRSTTTTGVLPYPNWTATRTSCAAVRQAAELAPENAVYHNNVGNALYSLRRYEEALPAYTRATELAPEDAVYHNNRGLALSKLDRYEDELARAITASRRAGP